MGKLAASCGMQPADGAADGDAPAAGLPLDDAAGVRVALFGTFDGAALRVAVALRVADAVALDEANGVREGLGVADGSGAPQAS
jgi:hypothetical protein